MSNKKMMLDHLMGIQQRQQNLHEFGIIPAAAGYAAYVNATSPVPPPREGGVPAKPTPPKGQPAPAAPGKYGKPGQTPIYFGTSPQRITDPESQKQAIELAGAPSAAEQRRRDEAEIAMDNANREAGLQTNAEREASAAAIRKERGTSVQRKKSDINVRFDANNIPYDIRIPQNPIPNISLESYKFKRIKMIESALFSLIEDDRFPVRENPPSRTDEFPSDPIRDNSGSSSEKPPSPSQVGREENERIRNEKKAAAAAAAAQAVKDRIAERERRKQEEKDRKDRAKGLKGTWMPSTSTGEGGIPQSDTPIITQPLETNIPTINRSSI